LGGRINDTAPQTPDVLSNPWSMPQDTAGDFGGLPLAGAAQEAMSI
jgi:hypothetical protein